MPRKKKPGPKPKAEAAAGTEDPKDNEPTSSSGPDEEGSKKEDKPAEPAEPATPEPVKPVMPLKRPRGRPSKKWQAEFLGKVFPELEKKPKKERKPREKKEKPKDKKEKKRKTIEPKEKKDKEVTPDDKESAPSPQTKTTTEEAEQKPAKEAPPTAPSPIKKPTISYLTTLKVVLDKLYEYKWPQESSGEYYLLEWQLADFLGVGTSLQSKHPGVEFHQLEDAEKDFLKEKGILNACHKDKATLALKSDDALLLLLEEYPEKYQGFIQLSHKREKYNLLKKAEDEKKAQESKKRPNSLKRALKDAVEFNAQLAIQRKEERCSYFDMQTQIIHVPSNRTTRLPKHMTQPSMYPVSLLPGQFQEHYKSYLPDDLRQLPVGTVLEKVVKGGDVNSGVNTPRAPSDSSEGSSSSSSSDDDDSEDDSDDSSSSGDGDSSSAEEQEEGSEPSAKKKPQGYRPPFRPDSLCGICLKGSETNKKGFSEDLIHCSQCENSGHPSCLDMNPQLVKVIETYPWQCMECKTCTLCRDAFDEDKMLFCDECDRGYHSFCVGLKQIPVGRWTCELCGVCASCLRRTPGEGPNCRWKSEYTKPRHGEEPQFLQTLCTPCSRLFRAGNFCPVCLKVYRNDESDLPMVCCDECDRWVHTDCDGIDASKYAELAKDKTKYRCVLCRGEKEERMDSFARKNRDHEASK